MSPGLLPLGIHLLRQGTLRPTIGVIEIPQTKGAAVARTQTLPWDPAEHLETEGDMTAYLSVALEEGDLSLIMATLGDIARTRRMAVVARETGLGRESLYKSLSADGNPEFSIVVKVVRALGLRLRVETVLEASGR